MLEPSRVRFFDIRDATADDTQTLIGLIRALARDEKLEHEVVATPELLAQALFGTDRKAFALICEAGGKAVGFSICFHTFSTFLGRPGIYIEDLYVEPEYRGRGIGKAIFRYLAKRALAGNCGRIEWNVLKWNESAIRFYASLGAVPMDEWQTQRITGSALHALAA
ncbi:MAG: GNAT family N-acetyltransferase [Rhodospirillaceae bacterium]|nr:GNAT family N-acetyltransferase [Rhodospirillaceae bacterium]